ncbi:MAG: CPBP family glutamic-type intramembrane protease [Treponema sp.]|nr:CPBP family glutamic-type intramembrane protease [Treponema sp.]
MGAVATYIGILAVVSLPFWIGGFLFSTQILPGLPVGSLIFTAPAISFFILVWPRKRRDRVSIIRELLTISGSRFPVVVLAILALPICVIGAEIAKESQTSWLAWNISIVKTVIFSAVFAAAAFCEELGWTGVLGKNFVDKFGVVRGGVFVGAIWAIWHLVPFAQTGQGVFWILGQTIYTIILRVLIFEFAFSAPNSMGLAILVHGFSNVAWQLLPEPAIAYDPWMTSLWAGAFAILGYSVLRLGAKR